MPSIIGSVSVSPAQAVPGESVLVEVLDPNGVPLTRQAGTLARINGITGSRQYLQFARAGVQRILVTAWRDEEEVEEAEATVLVVGHEAALPEESVGARLRALSLAPDIGVPLLRISHTPAAPSVVGLSVGSDTRFYRGLTTALIRSAGPKAQVHSQVVGAGMLIDSSLPERPVESAQTTYHWDFGDGSTATTNDTNIEHDYGAALGAEEEHHLFDVRVRIERAGEAPVEVCRTLSMFNAYAICKALGTIVPSLGLSRRP